MKVKLDQNGSYRERIVESKNVHTKPNNAYQGLNFFNLVLELNLRNAETGIN
jgi:hypothetical protein